MIFEGQAARPTALRLALAERAALSEHLVKLAEDGGLDELDDQEYVAFLQDVERDDNKTALLQHALIRNGVARDLPGTLCQTSMTRVLTQALRISVGEATRRVRAAEQVGDRVGITGQPMDPIRPVLAAAQRRGDVTPEQVHIIAKGLSAVDRAGFDPADIAIGEQILTAAAVTVGPKDLQGLTDRVVDAINPDGSRPRDELNQPIAGSSTCGPPATGPTGASSGSPALSARSWRRSSARSPNRASTRPGTSRIPGRSGNADTTPSTTSATGCSAPPPCRTPAAPPPPSSSPSPSTT